MKSKDSVQYLVRKQAGKDAVIILNKVDKMLKQDVARAKIESALAVELTVHLRRQLVNLVPPIQP